MSVSLKIFLDNLTEGLASSAKDILWGRYIIDMRDHSKHAATIASRQEVEREIFRDVVMAINPTSEWTEAHPTGLWLEKDSREVVARLEPERPWVGGPIGGSYEAQTAQTWARIMNPQAHTKGVDVYYLQSCFEQCLKILYAMAVSYDSSRKGDTNKFRNWVQNYNRGKGWSRQLIGTNSVFKSGTEANKKLVKDFLEAAKACCAKPWDEEPTKLTMKTFVSQYETYVRPSFEDSATHYMFPNVILRLATNARATEINPTN